MNDRSACGSVAPSTPESISAESGHAPPRVRVGVPSSPEITGDPGASKRRRPAHRAALPSKRPLVIAVGAVVLVIVGVTAVVALARRSDGPQHRTELPHSAASPSKSTMLSGQDTPIPSTIAWLQGALPRDARVAAPAGFVAQLRAHGYTQIENLRDVATTGGPQRWLVSRSGGADALPTALVARSVRVASIGSGSHAVRVDYLPADSTPSRRAALLREEHAKQVAAGSALADNRGVHTTSELRKILRRGGLDARPDALLAVLAATASADLVAVPVSGPEATVHRPARTVVLSTPTNARATAVTQAVSTLPAFERPALARTVAGRTTLVWHIAVDPVRTVS